MPIEDVQYLRKNSAQHDFVMFVDSSSRDKRTFPFPEEYSVTFAEPFRNVIGVEVVEMLVPQTMYNIDVYNNSICFSVDADPKTFVTLVLAPQTYTRQSLVQELTAMLTPYGIGVSSIGDIDLTRRIRMTSDRPFAIDIESTTAREVIGIDTSSSAFSASQRVSDFVVSASPSAPYDAVTVHLSPDGGDGEPTVMQVGTIVAQPVVVPFDGAQLSSLRLAAPLTATAKAEVILFCDSEVAGNNVGGVMRTFPVSPSVSSMIDLSEHFGRFPELRAGQRVWIGFRNTSSRPVSFYLVGDASGQRWTPYSWRAFPKGAFVSADFATRSYSLDMPGEVNLHGERCMLLRIPEIEAHMNSSYVYGSASAGLAMIKLDGSGDGSYISSRTDFNSVKYRNFHPIGKLARLSFRFETASHMPYNFRGKNHTLLIVIKYLVPELAGALESTNADYNPDVLQFIVENNTLEDDVEPDVADDIDAYTERMLKAKAANKTKTLSR
jgi:hypothetical protein